MKKLIVDTNKPWIPDGYTLEENRSLGIIDMKDIALWTSEKQKKSYEVGNEIVKKVPKPLTSAVLKYLLDNPTLIPKEWENKYVFFDGTILRDPDGERYTLYLYLRGGGTWYWRVRWLGRDRIVSGPSAVLASINTQDSVTQNSFDTESDSPLSFKKIYTKYQNDLGITAKVSEDKVTIKNSKGGFEFIFKNSKKETVRKVCESILKFLD